MCLRLLLSLGSLGLCVLLFFCIFCGFSNVFYQSFGEIYNYIQQNIYDDSKKHNEIINIRFWPGGDRDGNPFVKPDTTLKVAEKLKQSILKKYYADLKNLRRKLTFRGIEEHIIRLETILYNFSINLNTPEKITIKKSTHEILGTWETIEFYNYEKQPQIEP